MRFGRRPSLAVLLLLFSPSTLALDVWCGKAYRPSDRAFDPGGQLTPPERSPSPRLDLRIRPRIQPYLETDTTGTFVVDAALSYYHGQPYEGVPLAQKNGASLELFSNLADSDNLSLYIVRTDNTHQLIPRATVRVGANGTLFDFDLSELEPRFEPYDISVVATGPDKHIYTASTQIVRLPSRTDGGSVTKIDSLYGGLLVKTPSTSVQGAWEPVFPYSYYLDGKWLAQSPTQMKTLKDYGYNVLHIIPAGGLGYDFEQLDVWLDQAQLLGLWVMYDMRWQYQNGTGVEWQINRLKARPNILLWYTADEPDGHVDALDATKRAYDQIKSLDPYHPVSLCLNCENYHYEEYSAGADILLSDVYPIGTNTSWSTQYNTVCNTTYGCCGCDNCQGYNNISNVPARLDSFRAYQTQLGLPPKVLWGTPQAFNDQDFWKQTPTPEQEVAMTMLSINHGAKGIIMWTFPTTPALTDVTSRLAKVLTTGTCVRYLLGAELMGGLSTDGTVGTQVDTIDASAWSLGDSMLVSIVNSAYEDAVGLITLDLPNGFIATNIENVLWGDGAWILSKTGSATQIQRTGVQGLSTDILLLSVERRPTAGQQELTAQL